MTLLTLEGVSKRLGRPWRRCPVLADVTCSIPERQVVGLFGRNGAGKTTLFRILMSHLGATSGTIRWHAGSRRIWLPEGRALPDVGSAASWERLFEPLAGGRLRDLRHLLGIDHLWSRPVRQLSSGERRRVELALTLGADADAFLLDEPTWGLDPLQVEAAKSALELVVREGATVIVSTHLLRELEDVVDAVVLLDHGRVVASGESRRLCQELGVAVAEQALDLRLPGVVLDGDRVVFPRERAEEVAAGLRGAGVAWREQPAGLYDVFVAAVGAR